MEAQPHRQKLPDESKESVRPLAPFLMHIEPPFANSEPSKCTQECNNWYEIS